MNVKRTVKGFIDRAAGPRGAGLARPNALGRPESRRDRPYEGRQLSGVTCRPLARMDFACRGSLWRPPDPRGGRPLRADAVFVRAGAAEGGV